MNPTKVGSLWLHRALSYEFRVNRPSLHPTPGVLPNWNLVPYFFRSLNAWVVMMELRILLHNPLAWCHAICWCLLNLLSLAPWLRKLQTCRRHVAPTAKCRHIWPKFLCRGNTILIPTHFFVPGFADIHQIFLYSTRGTYREFLCKIWLKYLFDIRLPCTFLLLSTPKFKIFAVTRALPT